MTKSDTFKPLKLFTRSLLSVALAGSSLLTSPIATFAASDVQLPSEEEIAKMQEQMKKIQEFKQKIMEAKPFSLASANLSNGTMDLSIEPNSSNVFMLKLGGTLAKDGSGQYSLTININDVFGQKPVSLSPFHTPVPVDPIPDIKYSPQNLSDHGTFTFNAQSDPLTSFQVNWDPDPANSNIASWTILLDATNVQLAGAPAKVQVSSELAPDMNSVTLSVPYEPGASYQWMYETYYDAYGIPTMYSNCFAPVPGATGNTYIATDKNWENTTVRGDHYYCLITKNGVQSTSTIAHVPLANELASGTNYRLPLSTARTITTGDALVKALNLQFKYDVSGFRYFGGTTSPILISADTSQAQTQSLVEVAAPARPGFDYESLKTPGTVRAHVQATGNGIIAFYSGPITIEVYDENQPSSGSGTGNGTIFSDVPSNAWYTDYVLKANQLGLIKGSNGRFNPDNNLKRGDLALILYRLAGQPNDSQGQGFNDVNSGQYYYDAILWASKNGVVTGYTESGTFKPENNVSRQELVTMLSRYAKNIKGLSTDSTQSISSFPDAGAVSDYAKASFAWGVEKGILSGKLINGVNYLSPAATAKRSEAAKMLVSFVDLLN